jgi:outer membrane receptor protein involved in Fe transport
MRFHRAVRRSLFGTSAIALAMVLVTGAAAAQTTTGSIRGYVTNKAGAPLNGATISARNVSTGVQRFGSSRENGFYTLPGLTPGPYEVTAKRIGSAVSTQRVAVGVGVDVALNIQLGDTAVQLAQVQVVAAAPASTRSTEVATNVSQAQINDLPTSSRNFLDLAALAPGTHVDPDRIDGSSKEFSAGAQPAEQINVFIDGASYKNDIITGGVAGQDASRGNPFPRNAIQEFRIITNNFKAEYQKASSAIITAVTKSGTNTWHGGFFTELQNKALVSQDSFARADSVSKPDYSRYLVGANLGGPIVPDKLFLFGSYEGDYQNRTGVTVFGGTPSTFPAAIQAFNGTSHNAPFHENLGFAKLTYVPNDQQQLEVTGSIRHETDTRGFGGQFTGDATRVFESGENHRDNVYTGTAKHTYFGSDWTNEALLTYQHYLWNQDPIDFTTPIQVSFGNYWVGGDDAAQALTQNRFSARDDWTYTGLQWAGAHVIKIGANFDAAHYDMNKQLNENPKFVFDQSNNFQFPIQAQIGFGNPAITQNNNQFGAYVQDDWNPTSRLTLNLGVRWDVETGMLNRNYVTPAAVRDSILAYRDSLLIPIDPNRYISNGHNRGLYLGAIQPRVGVSYALDRSGRTVAFASFGVFYDRDYYNATLDETYRRQHPDFTINFLPPGSPSTGPGTVAWDPSFFSRQGLETLISQISPPQEVFLVPNDLKPPKSNQWSVGVRHNFGEWNGSLTYNGTRSYNGYSYEWANLALNPATDDCCLSKSVPAYQNVLVGRDNVHTWYDAMLVQVDRPYVKVGNYGWGAGLAYTLSKAEAEGGDLFSFPQITAGPLNARHPIADDRTHQFVLNAITDMPWLWGLQLSGLAQFMSGTPINKLEFVPLPNPPGGNQRILVGRARSAWFKNVDLRLSKNILNVNGMEAAVTGSVFNVFNTINLGCFDETFLDAGPTPGTTTPHPNWGHAGCTISDQRRFQLGVQYSF